MFKPFYLRRRKADAPAWERLTIMERWLRDGMDETDHAGAVGLLEVDLTQVTVLLDKARKMTTSPITYTPFLVRAIALALERSSHIHQVVAGNTRFYPPTVDIGLSVASEQFTGPPMVLKNSAKRSVMQLAEEISSHVTEARRKGTETNERLQQLGWIIPFTFVRRLLFRLLRKSVKFRLAAAGTFHVTQTPNMDVLMPLRLTAMGGIGIGDIAPRVIAVDGVPTVRTTAHLSCVINHSVLDGMSIAHLLAQIKTILETPDAELFVVPVAGENG